jgi:hypothetical protein
VDGFEELVNHLAAREIGETFNFLRDEVPGLDVDGGPAMRRANLLRYLEARSNAPLVAVGEAAGYCGARWSGIAFTSERTLASWGTPYMSTSDRPNGWTERSATIVHRVLEECDVEERVLLWNVVPTHPHRPGKPMSNRRPRAGEINGGREYTERLIELVRPRKVVAIGRVAARILGDEVEYIRHPANAGGAEFRMAMHHVLKELGECRSARSEG